MFTLSIGKILVLVAVIVAVWRGGRILKALQSRAGRPPEPPAPGRERVVKREGAVDLEPCPVCGIYKPAGEFCGGPEACRFKDGAGKG